MPRLAFGHPNAYGFMVWVFVGLFVAGLVISFVAGRWLGRARRRAADAVVHGVPPVVSLSAPMEPPVTAQHPGDEGVRLERLKTLAALRDSGALTEEEFQIEKRRILEGY